VAKFSITNGDLSDQGIVILAEYFCHQQNLLVLKLYNNIMHTIVGGLDLPYLLTGTVAIANLIRYN